jgi:CMP-N-acetylneuraminic acid synthetase
MKITAVVPIRKGSERVKNKNLRTFCDLTLLDYKIMNLSQISAIDEIIVNTDSDEAISIAKKYNVSYHRRLPYYASSECSNSEFLHHLGETTKTDIFAYCPVTSPLIKVSTIVDCINSFLSSENDSLATVSVVKEFLWLNNKPLNYVLENQPNSQNLPDIFALNFGLNLIYRNKLLELKNIVGLNPMFHILDEHESVDIDTEFDFYFAEQLFKNNFNG